MALKVSEVIKKAKNEIGYLEKKSNKYLDSKTKNAGNANITKYWRDVKPSLQGSFWCACFITWLFKMCFGEENAKKLLGMYPYLSCQEGYEVFYKRGKIYANPKVGDIVFFWSSKEKRFHHTAFVYRVKGDTFYTIEGNTSNGSKVVPNGGGVFNKSYSISSAKKSGHKFGRPPYSSKLKVKTKKNPLGCYESPNLNSKKVGLFKKDATVEVVSCYNEDWYKVKGKSNSGLTITGYSREKYLG